MPRGGGPPLVQPLRPRRAHREALPQPDALREPARGRAQARGRRAARHRLGEDFWLLRPARLRLVHKRPHLARPLRARSAGRVALAGGDSPRQRVRLVARALPPADGRRHPRPRARRLPRRRRAGARRHPRPGFWTARRPLAVRRPAVRHARRGWWRPLPARNLHLPDLLLAPHRVGPPRRAARRRASVAHCRSWPPGPSLSIFSCRISLGPTPSSTRPSTCSPPPPTRGGASPTCLRA